MDRTTDSADRDYSRHAMWRPIVGAISGANLGGSRLALVAAPVLVWSVELPLMRMKGTLL
jgi:hypothetical protein